MTDLFTTNAAIAPGVLDAIGYVRVSTESQIDGLGLDVQVAAIHALAATEGYRVTAIYRDEGISGSEDLAGRRGLADAIEALAAGEAGVLIIPKLDRLARDLMVQESILADAWKANATVVSCSETERTYCHPDNPDDPARALIRQVLGAVAAYERNMIRLRLVSGRRRRIAEDGYAGGPEPYGWSDADEQATLAHVAAARQTGRSWKAIAAELNRAGRTKRNGTAWATSDIHRTFTRANTRHPVAPASLELTPSLL